MFNFSTYPFFFSPVFGVLIIYRHLQEHETQIQKNRKSSFEQINSNSKDFTQINKLFSQLIST